MSQDIINEVMFLLHSLLLGIFITFVYDWFLILRRLIKHTILLVSLEDLIFWIACAISIFYMLYEENNGVLRWFAVAGAALGMLIYKKTVSGFFIKTIVGILSRIINIFTKIFGFILRPLHLLSGKIGKGCQSVNGRSVKLGKHLKKKLTEYAKLLKMILCKQ